MAYFRHFFSVDPAYAGMIPVQYPWHGNSRRGPRVCGDDPYAETYPLNVTPWTPRMWG